MWFLLFLLFVGVAFHLGLLTRKLRRNLKETQSTSNQLQQEKRIVLDFLHDLGEAFREEMDQNQILEIVLQSVIKVTSARSGVIYLKNADGTQLVAEALHGMFPPPIPIAPETVKKIASREEFLHACLRHEPLPIQDGHLFVQAFKENKPILIQGPTDGLPAFSEGSLQIHSMIIVPLSYREDKMGILAVANPLHGSGFNKADLEVVQSVANQAAFSLYNAAVFTQMAEKRALDRDLENARQIQHILLPQSQPSIPGYLLAATNLPAKQVSGDYYDFLQIDDTHIGLAIADVSGKGIPASLIMAMCRTVLRAQAPGQQSPSATLRQVNRILYPDIRTDMFITLCYMVLDTANHTLTLAKAGHDAPLFYHNETRQIELLSPPGIALGIDSGDVFDMVLQDLIVPLKPHDIVLVYTDGINEAVDILGEEFGKEGVRSALASTAGAGPDLLIQNIVQSVSRFRGKQIQNDDITLLALQRT